jgi:hypothetical protein
MRSEETSGRQNKMDGGPLLNEHGLRFEGGPAAPPSVSSSRRRLELVEALAFE